MELLKKLLILLVVFSSISARPASYRLNDEEDDVNTRDSESEENNDANVETSGNFSQAPDRRNHDGQVKYDYNCHCGISYKQPRLLTETELHQFISAGNHTKIEELLPSPTSTPG